jgi:hypothetical protein
LHVIQPAFLREGESMRRFGLLSALALALSWSGSAAAIQLTPTATARLHTIASGQPGALWNTTGGAQLSYNAGTGVATLTANLDVLNWFDTANGACATDVGSNCTHNYTTDLAITLDAAFVGTTVVPTATPNVVNIRLNFATTANALPDLSVLDPTDVGFGNVLEGDWQAGTYNSQPTTGLSFNVVFNTATNTVLGTPNGSGFLAIDSATAYAGLFASGTNYFGLNVATLSGFASALPGGLNGIIAYAAANNALPNFTAEANGQVYRVTSGEFVPEPGALMLLTGAFTWLGLRGRGR